MRQSISVPERVLYKEKDAVKTYALADGRTSTLASCNTGGKTVRVTALMHSLKQSIVVVFLEFTDSPGEGQPLCMLLIWNAGRAD